MRSFAWRTPRSPVPLEPGDIAATRRWLESEAQAARELLGRTRFLTPEPVALGEPGAGYPLPWSVHTWLPGTAATYEDPGESVVFAHDLAEFIRGVHAIDTRGRGVQRKGSGGRAAIPRSMDGDLLRAQ
jgi:aminoglycoside phosphotransferase (APT) family kinase protein